MKVVDPREYLFDVEMRDIGGEAAGLLNFIPQTTRIDRLMIKQCGKSVRPRRDGEGRYCAP